MSQLKAIFIGLGVLLIQLYLSEYLSVQLIRPDFLLIFVIYVSIRYGSLAGVIFGFCFGLLEDLAGGPGSLFGLAPLTKSLTGFFMGLLQGKFTKMNPFTFHSTWVLIVVVHFILYVYIRFQTVYETSSLIFWRTWLFAFLYTFGFIGILQMIIPLHKIYPTD